MNVLLFSVLIAGPIEPRPHVRPIEPPRNASPAADRSIVVVAGGTQNPSGLAADAIIDRLRDQLGRSWRLHVVRLDAEPTGSPELRVDGSNRDLVQVQPRTPMEDAITLALHAHANVQGLSAIVIIAGEPVDAACFHTGELVSSLRRWNVPVHTIHLAQRRHRNNVLQRIRRGVSNGLVWLLEALIEEDPAASPAADIGRFLSVISEATGGTACTACNREAGTLCANKLAHRITTAGVQ